jgi:hypothetical protein
VVVVEHPAAGGFSLPPAGLRETDRRAYSAAGVTLYRRAGRGPGGGPSGGEEE